MIQSPMQEILLAAAVLPILAAVYWALPPRMRSPMLALLSLGFALYMSGPWATLLLAGSIVITHRAGLVLRGQSPRRPLVLRLTLLWLLGSLCVFKYLNLLVDQALAIGAHLGLSVELALPRLVFPLGLSYALFRLVHFTVESYRRKVPEGSLVDLGCYTLFFPTYLSGPVERFPAFQKQTMARKPFDYADVNYGLYRLASGLVKKFAVADPLYKLVMPVLSAPLVHGRAALVSALYGLGLRVYLDFSGYTDMALGVSRLFGYRIMENFDLPYLKPNLAEVWRNWHISLYSFIRDYFFLPFFAVRGSRLKLYVGVFLTFVVFMVWHDGTMSYLLLGCYHGLGMMAHTAFQERKRRSPGLARLMKEKEMVPVTTLLAASFFAFGFVFFELEPGQVWQLVLRIFT